MVTTNVSNRSARTIEEITGSGASPPPRPPASQFVKGSIVSIRMKNFLVYRDVIASFGPRLNVVVGPNGSGKSTIVCAIALSLGGTPKMLGRADQLSAFVMHGVKEDASVTVELFIPQGDNLKITRTFSRRNNASNWNVGGRSMSDKQVKEKVAALGIQVENLCTMLPQDKVGDFSGFSPDKLLLETQKALSPDQLYNPHLELMDLQDSSGKNFLEEETTASKLASMQNELEQLEKDVQRFEERQEKEDRMQLHEHRKLWLKVEALRNQGIMLKEENKDAQLKLAKAEEVDVPIEQKCGRLEKEVQRLKGAMKTRESRTGDHKRAADVACDMVERMTAEAQTQKSEIQNIATRRKHKEDMLARRKTELDNFQEKLEGAREQSHASPCVDDLLAEVNAKQAESAVKRGDLKDQENLYEKAKFDQRSADENIKQLTNLKAVREKKFRQHYRDDGEIAMKVRDWAARNADQLRGAVSGPIGLEVTVNDPEAATVVEYQVPKHIWCSLVVDCKEDHDTIIRAFGHERRSISVLVNQGGGLKPRQEMFSPAEMENLRETAGVRGFVDDFIQCPDTIRQTLRRNCKIDRVFLGSAITQKKISSDPTFLPSLGKPIRGIPTNSVIYAGGAHGASGAVAAEPLQQYATKISLYGRRDASVRVSETRPAQVVGRGVDSDAVEEQELAKEGHERIITAAGEKRKKISSFIRGLDVEVEKLSNECKNVTRLKANEKKLHLMVRKTEMSIKTLQDELNEDGEAEKVTKINRLEQSLKRQADNVKLAQEHLNSMLDLALEHVAASMAKSAAEDQLVEARDRLHEAHKSRAELEAKVHELKAESRRILSKFKLEKRNAEARAPKCRNGDPQNPTRFGEVFDELPDNADELDAVIEDLKEDLQQSVFNPQVVDKYKKLKEEVEAADEALTNLKDRNANSAEKIKSISAPWMEHLQNVVDKLNVLFAEYMSNMDGCVGEIVLAKHESYKRWGVEIRVRFRSEADDGKMAVLNKLVHSGGERSVSTILYLMALQDLQHSPFRVVDEINQGMDPKNERGVFSRIVVNSCGPTRKQYFLITPKLLQGLVAMDNDDVTIIVIYNGKNTFNGTAQHTMRQFINAKKRQLAQEAGREEGGPPKQLRTVR